MPDITIEVEGLAPVQAKLVRLMDVGATCGPALLLGGIELRDWVVQYPPKSEANRPRARGGWYERGTGSKYARRDGSVRVVKRSEMLNRQWVTTHSFTPNAAEVVIGNDASYVKYVHDERSQAKFHAARGWRTAQAGIRKFEAKIVRRVSDAISRAIGA